MQSYNPLCNDVACLGPKPNSLSNGPLGLFLHNKSCKCTYSVMKWAAAFNIHLNRPLGKEKLLTMLYEINHLISDCYDVQIFCSSIV